MAKDTEFKGHVFKAGTILSVPSYTIHHLDSVWSDPFEYRPERWIEGDKAQLCVATGTRSTDRAGTSSRLPTTPSRSVRGPASAATSVRPRSRLDEIDGSAFMELLVFISTLFYRYDFEVEHPEWKELPSAEVRARTLRTR